MITMVVAMDKKRAIGRNNKLPWNIPEDLHHFKVITDDKIVVMGYKTYLSIGKPLKNRTNIVLSKNKSLKIDGVIVLNNIEQVLALSKGEDVYVIGGGAIYKQFLPYTDYLHITEIGIEAEETDTFFPKYQKQFDLLVGGTWLQSKNFKTPFRFSYWRRKSLTKTK